MTVESKSGSEFQAPLPPVTAAELNTALFTLERVMAAGGGVLAQYGIQVAFEDPENGDEEQARVQDLQRDHMAALRELTDLVILNSEVANGVPGALQELIDPERGRSVFARRFTAIIANLGLTGETVARGLGWSPSKVSRASRSIVLLSEEDALKAARYFVAGQGFDGETSRKFVTDYMQDWRASQNYRRVLRRRAKEPGESRQRDER
jgi:hypothetical protein